MSSTGLEFSPSKSPQDDPPNYNVIAPYAPPDCYPPTAPSPEIVGKSSGLELLLQINQLTVREKFTVSQGWGRSFDVLNEVGQRLFQVEQRVECCGPLYDVKIRDNGGSDVIQLFESCGCTCTRQVEVQCPPAHSIGYVKLHWNNLVTHLSVMNANQEVVLLILGPSLQTSIFGNNTFEVKSRDEQHVVGVIRMESGNYVISFPMDLEVTMKAILLGAAMYLDNIILSKKKNVERQARQRRN
ncbi:phospholipid scramblase 3-like [Pyxicephalus adspersus]|uniref:phospholipid scramblase 3-like n=1 Tax=Pyxicephalus adspersus TaxID=30357 RepID=UPI003B58E9D1